MGASVCCPERARRVDAEEAYEPFEPDELVYGAGYAGSLAGDNATKLDFTNTPSEQSSVAGSYQPPTARERLVSGTPILPVSKRRHAKKKSRKKGSKKKRKSQLNTSEADRARTYHHKISMDAISGESLNLDGDLTHPKYATYPPLEARLSGGSDHLRISEMLRPDNPTLIADLVDLERTERVKSFSRSRPHEHLLPSSVKTTLLEAHTPEPETSIIESLPSVTISVPTEDHTSIGSQELPDDVNFVDYDDARVVTEEEYHRSEALSYTTRRRMEEYNQTSNHRKSTLEELYDLQVEESLPWLTQLVREDEPNRRPRLSAISEARMNGGISLGPQVQQSSSLDHNLLGPQTTGSASLPALPVSRSGMSTASTLSMASSATAPYGDLHAPTLEDAVETASKEVAAREKTAREQAVYAAFAGAGLLEAEEPAGRGRVVASSRFGGRLRSAPGRKKRSKKKKKKRSKRGRSASARAFHHAGLP